MRLPDFLIIGAAKCGTTTLYRYLCKHPQIFMSTPKEPNFFGSEDNYALGIEWYAKLFEAAPENCICGEASTPYTHQLHINDLPQRIYKRLPDVKLIYIMRHPIDRAYSQYVQQIKIFQGTHDKSQLNGFKVPETFEQLLARGKEVINKPDYMEKVDVIAASHYKKVIDNYLRFFPLESFLFLMLDDLIEDPARELKKICQFLEIDSDIDLLTEEKIKANTATHHEQWYVRSRVTAPLKSIPGVANVARLLPQEIRDNAYNFLQQLPYRKSVEQNYVPKPMLPRTREVLLKEFHQSNRQLEEFLNRDLSHWSR